MPLSRSGFRWSVFVVFVRAVVLSGCCFCCSCFSSLISVRIALVFVKKKIGRCLRCFGFHWSVSPALLIVVFIGGFLFSSSFLLRGVGVALVFMLVGSSFTEF